ncbi:hypothetical protein BDM02DRAFT_3273571 [Thelephora ganbajun]|uniref:Uncharacterized protein n=1 Tax=Thelephora ganbajun TaxID=370292 RepID=A0ACB6YYD6_THEGA|nr:hypothetical protein BDM02DRAFT_3273571 [Thelephora ganbajun]
MESTPVATMNDEIPPLPPHWIFDGEPDSPNYTGSLTQRVVLTLHRVLCIMTFGGASIRPVWKRIHTTGAGVWEEGRDSLRERIQHTNIVGGLLLTTIATFCTTDPPKGSQFLPYTKEGPTCLFFLAFGFSFAGIIVGSTIVQVIVESKSTWFCDVMMGTRARIWLTMILLAYPFLAIGVSTCSFAAGLLVAMSFSQSNVIKYAGYGLVSLPLSCAFGFAWILTIKNNAKIDPVDTEKGQGSSVDCEFVPTDTGENDRASTAGN